jgi:hypothetical protein
MVKSQSAPTVLQTESQNPWVLAFMPKIAPDSIAFHPSQARFFGRN